MRYQELPQGAFDWGKARTSQPVEAVPQTLLQWLCEVSGLILCQRHRKSIFLAQIEQVVGLLWVDDLCA